MTSQSSDALTENLRQHSFCCDVCGTHFARREHLNRHFRSHTRERPFQCRTCQKNFTRADILQRHERCHISGGSVKAAKSGAPFRACISCASGRVRCSGHRPCRNCEKKCIECNYPSITGQKPSSNRLAGTNTPDPATGMETPAGDGNANHQHTSSSQECTFVRPEPIRIDSSSQAQDDAPYVQLSEDQEQQWDTSWTVSGNSQFPGFNHFPNIDTQLSQSENQHQSSFQDYESINWMSPSTSIWKDWDFRFASLADPSMSISFTPLLDVPMQDSNFNIDTGRTTSWIPETQIAISPNAIAAGNGNSPEVQSTTRSVHSLRSTGGSTSIVSSSDDPRRAPPRSYIDSVGARGTMQRPRRKRTRSSVDVGVLQDPQINASTQSHNLSPGGEELPTTSPWISSKVFQEMVCNAERILSGNTGKIDISHFPSLGMVNNFCQQYFENFHPEFPFLDPGPFQLKDQGWILAIAVSTIGVRYSESQGVFDQQKLLEYVLEKGLEAMINRQSTVIHASTATTFSRSPVDSLAVIQAQILSIIVRTRSREQNEDFLTTSRALADFKNLATTAKRLQLLEPVPNPILEALHKEEVGQRGRTGCMILILDFIFSYEFRDRALFDIAESQVTLPLSVEMSLSNDSNERNAIYTSGTLTNALEILFAEKRLVDGLSEFGCILLVQAICRQTIEMRRHSRNRMSDWTPTARSQSKIHFSDPELWPPSSTAFSKWRNSACDSLDVLHWSANSKIAQSKGFEHPTVLHLHLARLIILTPHEEIRNFAESYMSSPRPIGFDQYRNQAAYTVLQWAIRDQYKARLTVVHAGAIFWYMRRYSRDSFTEPFATFLSTLVLWAYSITTRLASTREVQVTSENHETQNPGISTSDSESDLDLSFINIDRPCDDESVQTFVKHGCKITANMVRVGNICAEGAPRKIIQEGLRLLSGRKSIDGGGDGEIKYTWTITKNYIALLKELQEVTQ